MLSRLFAQTNEVFTNNTIEAAAEPEMGTGVVLAIVAVSLLLLVIIFAAYWKVFQKAGKEGWKALIPVYNSWLLAEIAGRPGWWVLVGFAGVIPLIGIIPSLAALVLWVIITIDLAKSFGKGGGFAAVLILFPYIGYPMLAFGSATYQGPAGPEKGAANNPGAVNAMGQPVAPQSSPYAQPQPQQPAPMQPGAEPQAVPPQQPSQPSPYAQPQQPLNQSPEPAATPGSDQQYPPTQPS